MEMFFAQYGLVLLIIGVPALGGFISGLIYMWFKHRRAEMEAALKQEMIQRGMSADEIIKVLMASQATSETDLTVQLAEQGMSADEIVKVLMASQGGDAVAATSEKDVTVQLAEQGMSADDIAKVLQARRAAGCTNTSPELKPQGDTAAYKA